MYTEHMCGIYQVVIKAGLPNFMGTWVPVLFNLNLPAWREIATTLEQQREVDFLTYGFPAGFDGEIPSPSFQNHASACDHQKDVATYITIEFRHGAILASSTTPLLPLVLHQSLTDPPKEGQ